MADSARRRVWFAGGGTGGHLYPALAIARALVRHDGAFAPLFIGAHRGIERDVLPTTEFPHTLLDLHPLYRRTPWNNWRTAVGAIGAWRALSRLALSERPEAVIGTGGYVAGVALAWARAHGVPTVLHESDSHPGMTTRVFARGARAVYLGFPEATRFLSTSPQADVRALGAPIEMPPVDRLARAAARAVWNLPADAFVVLAFGGSQGARALNEAMAAWCAKDLPNGVALIWATGRAQASAYLDRESSMVRVRPYLSPIADAYAAADLAITRAGAISIAELCAWGIPSVLVPLPTAAQDHQAHNATVVAASGAAVHLPQSQLSVARLESIVNELRSHPQRLDAMRHAARERARPSAADDIAKSIKDLLTAR
ncbi:MAG: UDP-N-acetylglucosamine--N-acetylmuramyl-(pentapeptide) pyrophosphoryl-undecaprenol N-acetylglucosamine transferase [Gemmatimonadaceae bacterium]|nr:UDP-N-acetylglucosamine--N-acetylmuramyl-(pentapeptide) pyrophosphoryl-undecaprenol N-acetylglucosamine transferase [Gemmatimonadaceae bacterium]